MPDDLNCLKDRILAAAREVARDRLRRADQLRAENGISDGPNLLVHPPMHPPMHPLKRLDDLKPQGRVEDPWP